MGGVTWEGQSNPFITSNAHSACFNGKDFVVYTENGLMYSNSGISDVPLNYYSTEKQRGISGDEIVNRYGIDPTTDNLKRLGIAELTEQPVGLVAGYVPEGDKYKPIRDQTYEVEELQAEVEAAQAKTLEVQSQFNTLRSRVSSLININYTVTVATKTEDHPYYGQGSSSGYFLAEGAGTSLESPSISVSVGNTVVFDQSDSSNSSHPIGIYTTADKADIASGTITVSGDNTTFVPDTAGTYYYMCQAHGYMGGVIEVTD